VSGLRIQVYILRQEVPHYCSNCLGEDRNVFIWDLSPPKKVQEEAILVYGSDAEINQIAWSKSFPEWIAISSGQKVKALKI
jgi:hypothetical protein